FNDITSFFCSYLASFLGENSARGQLEQFVSKAKSLASACASVTSYTNPSSLWEEDDRVVQVYNARPDSGHWERGEGQFDSIDGRLMFTLDGMTNNSNKKLEFWMPQLSKKHPWISEQVERNYGSKRFRNINVVLSNDVEVKYLEDLNDDDLGILRTNQRLTLERKDWKSDLYKVKDLIEGGDLNNISRRGLKNPSNETLNGIYEFLNDESLYLSTHRVYESNWENDFIRAIDSLPSGMTIIAPRLNREQLTTFEIRGDVNIIFAEECSKIQLMSLRQLHRYVF
ncbi:hypothetical protein, partial [Vibrio parahaemolyticus]|uniref:hypothetical protein n=3 Tax=Vibrio TaxID=662 RepID=UPI0015DF5D38